MLDFDLDGVGEIFFSDGCVVRKLMHFCPPVYDPPVRKSALDDPEELARLHK